MQITYIGHATLLIEMGGARILTDPNFESTLGHFLPRVSPPGIALEDLPSLDALLVSHAHADHLSFRSLKALSGDLPLYGPPAVARWLQRKAFRHAMPLDVGTVATIGRSGLRIHTARATHEGSRYGYDRWRSAANMYLLESDDESVFFAGDTALTASTHALVERVLWTRGRELDVALLPIGYAPAWKPGFRRGHLTGQDAMTLFKTLRARAMIPYHWGTFDHVTASAYDAIDRLRIRLADHQARDWVHVIEPGESFQLDAAPRTETS